MAALVLEDAARVSQKLDSIPNLNLEPTPRISAKSASATSIIPAVLAGTVHGTIVLMSFASFAFVIFGNSEHVGLQEAFGLGISQQLLSAGLLIGILTFTGFFPFTMGGPTPPAALLVADVVRVVADEVTDPDKLVPTAMIAIILVTLLMGSLLVVLSATKTAVYAQQLPYPVLAGFLGGVGALLMRNAIGLLISLKLKWVCIPKDFDDVKQLDVVPAVIHIILGIGVALLLLKGVPRVRPLVKNKSLANMVLPVMFFSPIVLFYLATVCSGKDFGASGELRDGKPSWLFPKAEAKPFWELWINAYDVTKWEISAILKGIPQIIISAILCVVSGMINMAGIEANAPQDTGLNLNQEFMSLGRAELVTGLLGGHPGHHVAAFTLPMKKDGGTSRVAPWTAASLWIVCFLSSAPINAYLPRFFLGGCFLQVGFGLARTFLWDNRKSMDLQSKVIAYLTTFVAIMLDLNWAALCGFVVTALNFVRLSMNMEVVRAVERVDIRRSPTSRPIEEIRLLERYGHRIMVVYLEGYLFWGTVDEINAAFEGVIDGTEDDPSIVYIDLRYVHGIELSVINAIKKLQRLAGNVGISLVVCSIPSASAIGPELHSALTSLPFASRRDLDSLLEESEDKLIAEHRVTIVDDGMPMAKVSRSRAVALTTFASLNLGANIERWLERRVFDGWSLWSSQRHQQLRHRRNHKKQDTLRELVMQTQSAYAIQWELLDDGELCVGQTYNPPWRALHLVQGAMQKREKVSTFATGCNKYFAKLGSAPMPKMYYAKQVRPSLGDGNDCVDGMADFQEPQASPLCASFISKKALCADTSILPAAVFPRKELAAKHGINRMFFVPTDEGVIELGSLEKPYFELSEDCLNCLVRPGIVELSEEPARLLDLERSEASWRTILSRIGLGKIKQADCTDMSSDKPELSNDTPASTEHAMEIPNERVEIESRTGVGNSTQVVCIDKPELTNDTPSTGDTNPGESHGGDKSIRPSSTSEASTIAGESNGGDKSSSNPILAGGRLSPNLLISLSTLGQHQTLREGELLESLLIASKSSDVDGNVDQVVNVAPSADTCYIVMDGSFGTFCHILKDHDGNAALLLKSHPGALIGAEDVWANQPRSRQLKCLTAEAHVIAIHKSVMKKISTCDSPFVSPESSEEFVNYMMREMALNTLAMR